MNRQGRHQGRHAVVTGGARGIGAAIARRLLAEGARVTLIGRNADALAQAAARMRAAADDAKGAEAAEVLEGQEVPQVRQVHIEVADVSDQRAITAAFDNAARALGPVALLINNAGQAVSAPFGKTDAALWQRMLEVNLTGTVLCTQAALPAMQAAGWGRIVNVASTAGLIGYGYVSAYCAAKHGVIGLTRALALELAGSGVTVNAVCPGYTDTDIVRDAVANIVRKTGRGEDEALAELAARNPQRRLVRPDEVADAVAWLCGDGAAAVTGQAIAIAGGEVMTG